MDLAATNVWGRSSYPCFFFDARNLAHHFYCAIATSEIGEHLDLFKNEPILVVNNGSTYASESIVQQVAVN